jgi:ATP-dependent DNA ligase
MATTRDELYRLIDSIPASQLDDARKALEPLADPMLTSLADAPEDDEPETEEERAAVEEAWDGYRRGEWVSADEVRRELGL